jgi:hypothetical protein
MSGRVGLAAGAMGTVTSCRIDIAEGAVRIEGVDGPEAWLDVRYLDRSSSTEGDPVEDGVVVVERSDGVLSVRLATGGRMGLFGLLGAARRPRVSVDLRQSRDAGVEVATIGADVRVTGCRRGQVVSTVTGDAILAQADGETDVRSISGSVDISGGALDARAATTSGGVRVSAERIGSLRIRSVSGRIGVTGRLSMEYEHQIESVSGHVTVAAAGGAVLTCRTLSGRLDSGDGIRRDSRDGLPALVAGDGGARVLVRTVSGNVRMAAGRAGEVAPRHDDAQGSVPAPRGDAMLDALEALARGDITVEEADRRLEAIHG